MLRTHFLRVAARSAKSTTQIHEATQSDNALHVIDMCLEKMAAIARMHVKSIEVALFAERT